MKIKTYAGDHPTAEWTLIFDAAEARIAFTNTFWADGPHRPELGARIDDLCGTLNRLMKEHALNRRHAHAS